MLKGTKTPPKVTKSIRMSILSIFKKQVYQPMGASGRCSSMSTFPLIPPIIITIMEVKRLIYRKVLKVLKMLMTP